MMPITFSFVDIVIAVLNKGFFFIIEDIVSDGVSDCIIFHVEVLPPLSCT